MVAFGGSPYNNPLKPTVTRVTSFAEIAKPAPHYGGLVPRAPGMGDSSRVKVPNVP
jgi:hypothetical protein